MYKSKIARNIIALIVITTLLASNVFFIRNSDIFGSPFFFTLGFLIEIFFVIIFGYFLVLILRLPVHHLVSLIVRTCNRFIRGRHYKKPIRKNTAARNWLRSRFDPKNPLGLCLTIGLSISVLLLFFFVGISEDVILHESITQVDLRVLNLVPYIRTTLQTSIFCFFTMLGNSQTVVLISVLVAGTLWFAKKRIGAGLFIFAVITEEATVYLLKHLIGRLRPDQAVSLITEDKYGFPSGHVMIAVLVWGLLFYYIFKSVKRSATKLLIILAYIFLFTMIALSRTYLGVHFPSDVLASMFLGAAMLTLFITFAEIVSIYALWHQSKDSFKDKRLFFVPIIAIIFALVAAPVFIKTRTVTVKSPSRIISQINSNTVQKLPQYSETLTGTRMEPISLIFIGSKSQIENLFLSRGWYRADPATFKNTIKEIASGFQGKQYLTAPVTPSYLAAQPETLAFQHPTSVNTITQRHHTRIWKTNFRLPDGREVWVATASFDERLGYLSGFLPTHHINPNIDAERQYIIDSLGIENVRFIDVVGPQNGKNAAGDAFYTDGRAVVIDL